MADVMMVINEAPSSRYTVVVEPRPLTSRVQLGRALTTNLFDDYNTVWPIEQSFSVTSEQSFSVAVEQDSKDWGEVFLHKAFEPLDWVRYLADADQEVMWAELAALLLAAATTGDWQPYQRAFRAWQSTAEVVSDPELVKNLLAPWDPSEAVEISRP